MKSVVKKEKIVGGLLAGSRANKKKGADISGKKNYTKRKKERKKERKKQREQERKKEILPLYCKKPLFLNPKLQYSLDVCVFLQSFMIV